jgi:p-cumate 2,3-dioxygenase beta subunit
MAGTADTRRALDEALAELQAHRLRLAIEEFLYHEAGLLDEWRLDEWLALFTDDAQYVIPATDLPHGDPRTDLMILDDDLSRLRGRVERLLSGRAPRETPFSRTRRFISNVRVREVQGDEVHTTASFLVYRMRLGQSAPYVGRYEYTLLRTPAGWRIRHRRAILDHEALSDHGAVSIIV